MRNFSGKEYWRFWQNRNLLPAHTQANTYYARVHWQKIDFVNSSENQPEGDFYAESGELPADGIEEFIAMIDYQENEEKIRRILAKEPHQRALEIYRETKSLTDYFYPPD